MEKETTKRQSDVGSFCITFFIILFIALPIILGLTSFYYNFQKTVFSNADTLIFIHDRLSRLVIVFSPLILLFCIASNIKDKIHIRIMKIKIFWLIFLLVFVISLFILVFQFFKCVDINKDGIYVRNGIFSTSKNYMWSDVTNVDVSYEVGYKHEIEIDYNIYFNDGITVNASNSEDFFSNIVNLDNSVKEKGIKINRSNIKSSDYGKFTTRFDADRMKVILKILNK